MERNEQMSKLKVEYVPTDRLKTYANNAKIHTAEQIEQIKRSIQEFGFNDPIAVWKDNEIIEGHGRLIAALELGIEDLPIIRLDNLTDEQRKAYTLVHNKLTMNTDFDFDILNIELDDIVDFDMSEYGFDLEIEEEGPIGAVEDNYEPIDVESRCKTGDVWQLGSHRLICGDSTDVNVIEKLMNGQKADMSFTSPPYNVGDSAKLTGNTHMTECKYQNGNDELSDYNELLIGTTDNMLMFSKWSFINLQMLANNKRVICEWLNNYKDSLCDIAIWYKNATAPAMAEKVMNSQFEFVFIFSNDNNSRAIGTKNFRGTVSNVYIGSAQRKNDYSEIHSATFPVEFANHFVGNFTNEGDSVLDVFGGTGTTMIVCEQLNRKCYMCELDESYCDVIIDRWEKFTGQKAEKING